MLNDSELLKLFLPELLIDYFEILKFEEENKILHIYFEEKNTAPKEFSSLILQSKGFVPEIMVDDFPLRGKTVKLHIKRRRWTDTKTGNIIQRDWNLIAKGTRMTQDFAEFLKKNQPILKRCPAKPLVRCMAWMVENSKDSTNKASVILKIGNKNRTQKTGSSTHKTSPGSFLWMKLPFLMENFTLFSLPKQQKVEREVL